MRLANLLGSLLVAAFGGWFIQQRAKSTPVTSWDQVKPETDPARIAAIDAAFVEMVGRIEKVRPDAIQKRTWSKRVMIHPGPTLPPPHATKWGVAFPEHADGGNPGGNIVLLDRYKDTPDLWRHEVCHLITGLTDHPSWLFGKGLILNV